MLGVGIMGLAMAVNLMKAGFQVTGYDPDPKAMKRLKAAGGTARKSAADLAADAQVIICSLPGPKATPGVCRSGRRSKKRITPSAMAS